ncbi:putative toxin-antitoxin system toxin component, PIN family [Peribacillus phoenicis]|uniref:putative toxin-antitoxin system toxin component, PIN family n=1 Tax=unclassified Peribacillus TaxID=2675266 RepID=UPI0039A23B24
MINKPRVVIDTNVFIDGNLFSGKNSEKIMKLFKDIKITLLFSQNTIGELVYMSRIMSRKVIRDIDLRMDYLNYIMYIFYHSKSINTIDQKEKHGLKCKDERDDMFIDCAYYGKADYLITDDKNSGLHKMVIGDTKILTADEFIAIYEEEHGEIIIDDE